MSYFSSICKEKSPRIPALVYGKRKQPFAVGFDLKQLKQYVQKQHQEKIFQPINEMSIPIFCESSNPRPDWELWAGTGTRKDLLYYVSPEFMLAKDQRAQGKKPILLNYAS